MEGVSSGGSPIYKYTKYWLLNDKPRLTAVDTTPYSWYIATCPYS